MGIPPQQCGFGINQVPLRNYITFLELLGITLAPPKAASVELTFYLTKEQGEGKIVPERTEVATIRTETNPAIVFTTDEELIISPPCCKYLLLADNSEISPAIATLENPFSPSLGDRIPTSDFSEELALFPNVNFGNCFYLVLGEKRSEKDEEQQRQNSLKGHVLALIA